MSSPNRAHRRREARASAKQPVIIAGDGIVAGSLGHTFEARPHADLPAKRDGEHRWVATAAFVLDPAIAERAFDPDTMKFLDHENLLHLAIGCWDCEQVISNELLATACPAPGDDRAVR